MSIFFTPLESQKLIIRGAFNYLKNGTLYTEESFTVYKDYKIFSISFISEMDTRLVTGELLRIKVLYSVGKDYVPKEVKIQRTLGSKKVVETYYSNKKENRLTYNYFDSEEDDTTITVATGPKFHIATPATAPSMLFLNSKRIDPMGDNYFTIFQCFNHWKFKNGPTPISIVVRKISLSSERITIDGNALSAMQYYIFEGTEDTTSEEQQMRGAATAVKVHLSPYLTIPYIVQENDGTRIQIKYLNNLED